MSGRPAAGRVRRMRGVEWTLSWTTASSALESGKDKGYLTYGQVNDYLPDDAVNPEKLDQLLQCSKSRASS